MGKTFILNDESVNRYGFRVLTSGIDLTNFLKNPIALFMHQRASWTLPIGKWTNVRKEGDKLLADLEIDETDEFAVKIKNKIEQGIFNACSIGFEPKETSSQGVMEGQTLETVTKCELLEASVVDIPANANAVKLFCHLVDTDEEIQTRIKSLNYPNMKKLALKFNLSESATEDEVLAKIESLEKELQEAKTEIATLKADKDTAEKEAIIAPHLASGQLKAEQKPSLLTMGVEDLKSFLSNMPKKTLSGQVGAPADDKKSKWSFNDWSKKDAEGLLAMKNGTHSTYSKEDYARLFKDQFDKD